MSKARKNMGQHEALGESQGERRTLGLVPLQQPVGLQPVEPQPVELAVGPDQDVGARGTVSVVVAPVFEASGQQYVMDRWKKGK